jgi:hypothetical protein
MKGAIASVEIFVFAPTAPTVLSAGPGGGGSIDRIAESGLRPRRLSLVIGIPERVSGGASWQCRVALADLHRPQVVEGRDSVEALSRAVDRARAWLTALADEGHRLARDRAGSEPFASPFLS